MGRPADERAGLRRESGATGLALGVAFAALLADVGERVRGALRPGELAGRIGGGEFVVVSEGHASAESARRVVERLHGALAGNVHGITASIGVASVGAGAGWA